MNHKDTPKLSGGGVATQAGITYQNRVAAWFCVRILAEQEVASLWGLPENATLDYIRCETEQPVDDILVGTSQTGHAFIQVKHTVTLATTVDSALASSLAQFIKQYLSYTTVTLGRHPWERPLDTALDRLVLVTSPTSSTSVRLGLPSLLTRIRNLGARQNILEAATNDEERRILSVVRSHLQRLWAEITGKPADENDERELLSLVWIQVLDVDPGGRDEREAKNILRSSIVKDTGQTELAWDRLVIVCEEYARLRSGADRSMLQQQLLTPDIRLNAPRSYRTDNTRLLFKGNPHSTSQCF